LKSLAGIDIVHVPYKGSTPALSALVGGEVSMMFSNVADTQPHIKSGRMRPLAVTSTKRATPLPDVPTMEEAGLRDFQVLSWFGLLAPARTPAGVITRVNAETVKVLLRPDAKAALGAQGLDVISGTPDQFANHIKAKSRA
jgi:tripartite-type tricarboxylate transporter receptor subunit TctC